MITIGLTMGCPAGIGPEILLRLFLQPDWEKSFRAVVLGDIGVLSSYGRMLGLPAPCHPWHPGEELPATGIPVLPLSALPPESFLPGRPTRESGRAMAAYIHEGVALIGRGVLSGMTTCPISKAALHDAGYHYPGHTEMLAHLSGASEFTMMMAGPRLKLTLATIHCPLRQVAGALTVDGLERLIRLTDSALRADFALAAPTIGVAGLNPHAGEALLFGREEAEVIAPAVKRCQELGLAVSGPYPPDTIFHRAANGAFDAVVAMYHDQGLIPFKLLHFHDGVNVTLGLPLVRTSVDHGTAYDIAGKGLADPLSLRQATVLAAAICRNRAHFRQVAEARQ
jgi:4-hydroxythreonine-4-phosphate dehydrogenase